MADKYTDDKLYKVVRKDGSHLNTKLVASLGIWTGHTVHAIFNDTDFDITGAGESVKNLYGRYQDIQDVFPADITDDMLLHFCDWVAEKVFFIEIVATTEQDAHKIFVTMNDRGLSLTSTEMLKGYLLSEIKSDSIREKMNGL